MGKFKELDLQIKQIRRDQQKRQLQAKYPAITDFITECFLCGEEDKVYKLIMSLSEVESCSKKLH